MAITSMGTEAEEVATTTMGVAAAEAMATVADDGKFSSQIERGGFQVEYCKGHLQTTNYLSLDTIFIAFFGVCRDNQFRGGPPGNGGYNNRGGQEYKQNRPMQGGRPCKFFSERGYCREGDSCGFAHIRRN